MLKRLVKEATGGFSSSGEQSARRKKPTTRRSAASSSSGDERGNQRKGKRKEDSDGPKSSRRKQSSSKDDTGNDGGASRRKKPSKKPADTPAEDEPSSARRKKNAKNEDTRRKNASRMKREPLLEYSVIETVHSAMHGKKKKRARQELLELFGSYDTDDTGAVDSDKFKKCIAKVGIKLKRSNDVDALVRCFTKVDGRAGGDDEDESSDANAKSKAKVPIDYVGFVDFACNVRDSEKLSAVAVNLRDTIRAYDDKHDRATTVPYNISSDLKKLDKNKRGWIASDRFGDFMQDHERPTFRLSHKDIEFLTERFEYEYDKGTLGFDYIQFARWLQPMLHLDKKELHARVKQLIQAAQESGGWELAELFEAIDESADGHVSAFELKRGMFDMGLPLTDAQIQCLVEEYDIDGDGKIQYNEFVSLFEAPMKKRKPRQQESDNDSDPGRKNRPKSKANVRNTFSWAINKAFARKHASQASKQGNSPKKTKRQQYDSSSSESERKMRRVQRNAGRETVHDSDSASEEGKPKSSRLKSERISSKKAKGSSDDSSSTDTRRTGKGGSRSKRGAASSKKRASESLTESDSELRNRKHRRKRTASGSDESSHSDNRRGRKQREGVKDRTADTLKRKSRNQSAASTRSRNKPRGRSRSTRRQPQTRETRASAQRVHSSHPPRAHSRNAALPSRTNRKRAQSAGSTKDGRSGSDSNDHSAGSESGLDLDEVRKLHNQPRRKLRRGNQSGSEEDEYTDSGDASGEGEAVETNKSDREYYKLLKTSLRRAFEFFDTEHTETISKRNIGHVLRALGHEYSSRELDREIHRADLDKNGEMDFHEFNQLVKRQIVLKAYLLSKRREMEIRQAFQSVDASKGGCVDENEFEFLVYKVLQVELSVEEQDALLDAVENGGGGVIHEEEFIGFMKTLEGFHKNGVISRRRQSEMLESLDAVSRLACSAVKKLIRGAPMDLDKNLLMLLGVPTNYRQALTSADVCRDLHEVSMEHALGFPCPETIVGLAQDPIRVSAKKESSILSLGKSSGGDLDDDEAKMVLKQAESWQAHAIVSLKRATGVPKPFDTREEDVVKRSVHVALYQEQDDPSSKKRRHHAKTPSTEAQPSRPGGGMIVGNVHEIPVYWNPSTEDVWEFSRKSTKEDKYKFVVRTNNVNDRLYLLVEFIVHLRTTSKLPKRRKRSLLRLSDKSKEVRELAACWCKIPIRTLLAQRLDIYRTKEKLWGGTIDSPIDIEQDEILRRRTGWRAITNAFTKPTPPSMGIKSVPIQTYPEEIQAYVRKMPPLIIAPFVSLPIVAEYMITMQSSMWLKQHAMTGTLCEPVLKLLPKIIDDHEALSVFRRAFDSELSGVKNQEDRQKKFQELVLRMWPSFLELLEKMPQATLQDAKATSTSIRRLSLLSPTGNTASQLPPAKGTTNETPSDHLARFDLLQCSAQGYVVPISSPGDGGYQSHVDFLCFMAAQRLDHRKLRLRNVPVAAAPFHVREVTFERLI